MKKIIQNSVIIIVIMMTGFLMISNIEHIIYLKNYRFQVNYESDDITKIKESLKVIKENTQKLDKIQNSYLTIEELTQIKTSLSESILLINDMPMLKEEGIKNLSQAQFFKFVVKNNNLQIMNIINNYRILSNYDKSLDIEMLINNMYMQLISVDTIYRKTSDNYKYMKLKDSDSTYYITYPTYFIKNMLMRVKTIEEISNITVESGEINE